jgi:hypothetical protein
MGNRIENVNFKQFHDEYGNLKKEFEVIKYDKRSNGEWVEESRFQSGRGWYEVDGRLYFRSDNSLIETNTDFDSKKCGVCYKIGNEVMNRRLITGNEVLFESKLNNRFMLRLHKQSYSNGTCFYSLQDQYGHWNVSRGGQLEEIIEQIKHELTIDSMEEAINWHTDILNKLLEVKQMIA